MTDARNVVPLDARLDRIIELLEEIAILLEAVDREPAKPTKRAPRKASERAHDAVARKLKRLGYPRRST